MTIPIVQGTELPPNYDKSQPTTAYTTTSSNNYQDQMTTPINTGNNYGGNNNNSGQQLGLHAKQPNQFRDSFWAVLFVLHFIPLILYAFYTATQEQDNDNDQGSSASISAIGPHLYWISTVAVTAVGLSTLSLEGLMRHADGVVKFSLISSVALGGLIGLFGLMSGQILVAVLGFLQFAIGIWYAYVVWKRIPYAVANLRTGLTAVRLNMGVLLIAYIFMALGFAWTLLFFLGFGNALAAASYPVLFCWLVSFYWVHQVLQYTVHVICAGVIATWWFNPLEAASCFSSALQDSMIRALTYSFGSICFGAFLVAVVRALRVTLETARRNDDAAFLVCIIECFLRCIEDMIDYLNQWAYVYIGIYGFGYIDAGREVINLFQQRGWTVLITDDLVDRVVLVMSMCIGLISGVLGMFVGQGAIADAGVEEAAMSAFIYSFLLGFLFSSIALGIVGSAVNTTIVLFCEAPAELQRNHPALSNEMRAAWSGAWPELGIN